MSRANWGQGTDLAGLNIRHPPNRVQLLSRFPSTKALVIYRSTKRETGTVIKVGVRSNYLLLKHAAAASFANT